jgi:hypothetical protein
VLGGNQANIENNTQVASHAGGKATGEAFVGLIDGALLLISNLPSLTVSHGWTTGPVVVGAAAWPACAACTMSSISCWLGTLSITALRRVKLEFVEFARDGFSREFLRLWQERVWRA